MNANNLIPSGKLRIIAIAIISYLVALSSFSSLIYWSTFGIDITSHINSWRFIGFSANIIAVGFFTICILLILLISDGSIGSIYQNPVQKPKFDVMINKMLLHFDLIFFKYDILILLIAFIFCMQIYNTEYYNKWTYMFLLIGACFYGYFHVYIFPLIKKFFNGNYYVYYLCAALIFLSIILIKLKAEKIYYNIDYDYYEPEKNTANSYFEGECRLKYIGQIGNDVFFTTLSNKKVFIIRWNELKHYSLQHYKQPSFAYNKPHQYTNEMGVFEFFDSIGIPGWLSKLTRR